MFSFRPITKTTIGLLLGVCLLTVSAQATKARSKALQQEPTSNPAAASPPAAQPPTVGPALGTDEKSTVTADIFDLQGANKIGSFEVETTLKGDSKKTSAKYLDASGKIAVQESAQFTAGVLDSWSQEQSQSKTTGQLSKIPGTDSKQSKVKFEFTNAAGVKKSTEENWVDNFIVPPMLVTYIQKNWSKLQAGETLNIRFGVLERLESVGFKLARVQLAEDKVPGMEVKQKSDYLLKSANVSVIKMSASNLVISAIVDPIYFAFDNTDQRLVSIRGRTVLKLEASPGNFKNQDALTLYK